MSIAWPRTTPTRPGSPPAWPGIAGMTVTASPTNIVFASVDGGRAPALLAHLEKRGVLATGLIGLRFVTHLDVDAEGVDRALAAVAEFMTA